MANTMNTPVLPDIDWVGYVDWNVRDFHSYDTHRGATYNAYLVRDEKTALIDTVKAPFAEYLLRNIQETTPLEKVDYIVCNHAEPDHTGAMPQVMKALPNATLVCNARCRDALADHYDLTGWPIEVVSDGQSLSLGRRTMTFIDTPMVHWPESMFTYLPEDKILFSMDAFGQHLATSARFADQVPQPLVMGEAKAYYANIVTPYSKQVRNVLSRAADLEISVLAPSHGVIWRKDADIQTIIAAYDRWSAGRVVPKVLVMYDSMWDSTTKMGQAIFEGAVRDGVDVNQLHVRRNTLTYMATELLDAAAVAFGSATLNTCVMPAAAAILTYAQGLRFSPKSCFAFGSYGWGRGAPEQVDGWLRQMKWDVVREPIKVKYRPTEAALEECHKAGQQLAAEALARAEG